MRTRVLLRFFCPFLLQCLHSDFTPLTHVKVPILCFYQLVSMSLETSSSFLKVFSCFSAHMISITIIYNTMRQILKSIKEKPPQRNDTCYMVTYPSICSLWETYEAVWTFVFKPSGSVVLPSSVMWTNVKTTVDCMIKVIALATAFVQTTPTRWFCLLFWLLQTYIPVISRCCFMFCSPHWHFYTSCMLNLVLHWKITLNVLHCWKQSLSLKSSLCYLTSCRFCNQLLNCIWRKSCDWTIQGVIFYHLCLQCGTKTATII